jgi:hypothetical protein
MEEFAAQAAAASQQLGSAGKQQSSKFQQDTEAISGIREKSTPSAAAARTAALHRNKIEYSAA